MRSAMKFLVVAMILAFSQPAMATVLNFDMASETNAVIRFAGNSTFSFPNTGPWDFQITTQTGFTLPADLIGLQGNLAGTFTIGVVTLNTAPVTGTGAFSIYDGSTTFSADIQWLSIAQVGAVGGLNYLATANLTNLSYSGTNSSLSEFLAAAGHTVTASYQFQTTYTLAQLKTNMVDNSYSMTARATVPEPTSALLLGAGLFVLGLARRLR